MAPANIVEIMEPIVAFIAKYGLLAVFAGCLAEGESIAVVGGFFAHQGVLPLWETFAVAAVGAFLGDALLFVAGRHLGERPFVKRMQAKPGFSHALDLARRRPRAFVFFNRYVYGMRIIGGIAAGIAAIPIGVFVVWNALSSLVWATFFIGIGYFFGLSAEALFGKLVHDHQRLVIGLGILAVLTVVGVVIARRVKGHETKASGPGSDVEN